MTLDDLRVPTVDAANRIVGEARRGDVLPRALNFRTVHVLLFDGAGRLLLQRLPADHRRSPGRLGSSVAGYVLVGESYAEAARRKTADELGLTGSLDYRDTLAMTDQDSRKFVGVFTGTVDGPVRADPAQIAELVWLDVDTVESMLRDRPDRFTPTFRVVFDGWRRHPVGA